METKYWLGWNPILQSVQRIDAFTMSNRDAFNYSGHDKRAPPNKLRRDVLVTSASRRDPLVGSVNPRSMFHLLSPGTTSVPLRGLLDAVEGAPPGRGIS